MRESLCKRQIECSWVRFPLKEHPCESAIYCQKTQKVEKTPRTSAASIILFKNITSNRDETRLRKFGLREGIENTEMDVLHALVLCTGSVHSRVQPVALRVHRVCLHVPVTVRDQLLPTCVGRWIDPNHLHVHIREQERYQVLLENNIYASGTGEIIYY